MYTLCMECQQKLEEALGFLVNGDTDSHMNAHNQSISFARTVCALSHCLSQCSIAVNRHHDRGKSYKGKYLIEGCSLFKRFLSTFFIVGSMEIVNRPGAGEVVESSTSESAGSRK